MSREVATVWQAAACALNLLSIRSFFSGFRIRMTIATHNNLAI